MDQKSQPKFQSNPGFEPQNLDQQPTTETTTPIRREKNLESFLYVFGVGGFPRTPAFALFFPAESDGSTSAVFSRKLSTVRRAMCIRDNSMNRWTLSPSTSCDLLRRPLVRQKCKQLMENLRSFLEAPPG